MFLVKLMKYFITLLNWLWVQTWLHNFVELVVGSNLAMKIEFFEIFDIQYIFLSKI